MRLQHVGWMITATVLGLCGGMLGAQLTEPASATGIPGARLPITTSGLTIVNDEVSHGPVCSCGTVNTRIGSVRRSMCHQSGADRLATGTYGADYFRQRLQAAYRSGTARG